MLLVADEHPWEGPKQYLVCVGDTLYKFSDKDNAKEFAASDGLVLNPKAESYNIAAWRKNNRGVTCCNLAFPIFCVCRISWRCPDHYGKCIGSHD